jgi:poly(hydroxyalkanoate) depolymerase family esterase
MGNFLDGVFSNLCGERKYKLYVSDAQSSERRPLVVMLHGCAQDASDFAAGTRMNTLADEFRGVVLYPEQSRTINAMGCWNWHDVDHQSRLSGEPSLIAGMTQDVIGQYRIDSARVYVAGMSAGGAMAAILGQQYPELYAAVGVHSGIPCGVASDLFSGLMAMVAGVPAHHTSPPTAKRPVRTVPTIVFHGDQDSTVHPSNAVAVHGQARRQKHGRRRDELDTSNVSSKRKIGKRGDDYGFTRTAETRNGVSESELWMVHGAGHTWMGGSPDGSYTDSIGPDASREMLRFFLQQNRERQPARSSLSPLPDASPSD